MVDYVNIKLWGKPVGSAYRDAGSGIISFEYEPSFVRQGYSLSPLFLPLASGRIYSFPELSYDTFKGLPGFLADSLPDKFGNDLINRWLAREGRPRNSYNAIERLLYQGTRAMGALEFEPAQRTDMNQSLKIELDGLVNAAINVLGDRKELLTNMNSKEEAMRTILQVGTSAGGARAKAVVAYNRLTGEIRSGQVAAPEGFEHYLLKLDGVTNGSLGDPTHYGSIEYSYYRMARACGIDMSESQLLSEGRRKHFMTKRFDRRDGNRRIHMVSLCGLAHMDFNLPGAYSYEQLFNVMREMHLTHQEAQQAYRRMVFNIVGRNQDDHTKNFAFLLDTDNQWRLAPAYDMVYAYNKEGSYTNLHQMSVNGKRDNFTLADLLAIAENIHLKEPRSIIADITDTFRHIDEYLEPDIPQEMADEIKSNLRLNLI